MATNAFVMQGNMNSDQAQQIAFHSIFGTYKEDLSLLSAVTEKAVWNTRTELGNSMQQMGTSGKKVAFKYPQFKYFSRMSSANVTGLLTSTSNQLTSKTVFSGKRNKVFSEDFFAQLRKDTIITAAASKSLQSLAANFRVIKLKLLDQIEKQGRQMVVGTVDWYPITQVNDEKPAGPVFVPPVTGKLFLARE